MSKKIVKKSSNASSQQLAKLQQQLVEAQGKERRVLADYQNLVRRTGQERLQLIKLANRDLLVDLLGPLEHLTLAANQSKDQGLVMILEQFKRTLTEFGLVEIEVLGKEFDVNTMEAVEGSQENGKVAQIVHKGYQLNGQVIQHAKVILK